ncbi:phospholipid carrier-dependent glycosyltransferase [Polynucleobacter sp. MWH-P3-07-1]|uniref:ArnT family glycosyltransferase n=1 Tax=Polynucleobacter sp. MWH-P3-07-1 TaxID=1743173 RepID=UPI001BFD221D|nr:phospholipid carrier-dependent glycosyltransferase [Polynucleobacter sp. MWH-P3-07-1]QWD82998.1 phospholipid carrier-dependent glycosyltransferase [Polynucleobacter sp. MWH-P3-07-1]
MQGNFSIRSALLILLLAVVSYFYGLDSRFAPKNGDEYPYMHIVRLTADSGHWLPLQSEMDGLKNTKPPLLFWQGIASTSWASQWTLWNLRWPNLLYTGLTAFFLFLAVRRFSAQTKTGILAALVWLAFFSSYRYGRPFLTDPAEVFFLTLPFMGLLYWGKTAFDSRLLFPVFAALCFGLALLAKSFAYIVPATFALTLYYWRWREWSLSKFITRDLLKLALIVIVALGVFALWFLLDPSPEAIWREFVLGENAGKFQARSSNYLFDLFRGGDSIWMLILTTLANAGLFIAVLVNTLWQCWRERRFLSIEENLLLLLIAAFLIVFSLPSQRSGRYLLPVMPAFAALIALHWQHLSFWGFRFALVLQLIILGALTWVGFNLQAENPIWHYSSGHWVLMAISVTCALLGLTKTQWCKSLTLAVCFLSYCALNSSLAPLEGALGRYDFQAIEAVQEKAVWIPCDYRAKDEEYRLLLPGAQLHGYPSQQANDITGLLGQYPLVAVQAPLNSSIEEKLAACPSCNIIGHRMEMRARQTPQEIEAILKGHIGEYLFVNEYLIAGPAIVPSVEPGNELSSGLPKDACR